MSLVPRYNVTGIFHFLNQCKHCQDTILVNQGVSLECLYHQSWIETPDPPAVAELLFDKVPQSDEDNEDENDKEEYEPGEDEDEETEDEYEGDDE